MMLRNCPIMMDGRMLGGGGTGVGTYSEGLRIAIVSLTDRPLLLNDRLDLSAPPPLGRAQRWTRALSPFTRAGCPVPTGYFVPDVFRIAQAFFDVHRRLLPIHIAGPRGIVHWTYPIPVRVEGWTNLYTVHDVIPLSHPELTGIASDRHRRILDLVVANATRIVAVSEAARREIVDTLGCPPDHVVDCGQAAEPLPSCADLPEGLTAGGYLLAVGTVEPRKNIARLCAAYHASGVDLPLVIVGKDGADISALAPALTTPGVRRLPYLPEPTIRALLGHARALLMPSLAEGFGLPVIEAMALDTPVLTSHDGALAEVAGGAALLVDPYDERAIARGIRQIAFEKVSRRDLLVRGRVNARRYTHARFAERLGKLYASL